jgi:hypothetical protein
MCKRDPGSEWTVVKEESMNHAEMFEWKYSNSTGPRKARQVKSKVESMLIILFDIKGTDCKEFIIAVQTVKSAYYLDILQWQHENV